MTPDPWTRVRADELVALHRIAQQAREAVEVAAAAGVHLGPLRAALADTAYAVPAARQKTSRDGVDIRHMP